MTAVDKMSENNTSVSFQEIPECLHRVSIVMESSMPCTTLLIPANQPDLAGTVPMSRVVLGTQTCINRMPHRYICTHCHT